MDGHAPANPLRRSLPGTDRVKPERNLGAAKPPSAKSETNLRPSPAQVTEPPYADPHVRWCGRGGAVRLPPIPIVKQFELFCSDDGADYFAGDHQFYAPILLASIRIVVGSHWLSLAEALRRY